MNVCVSLLMSDTAYAEKEVFANRATFEELEQDYPSGNCSFKLLSNFLRKIMLTFRSYTSPMDTDHLCFVPLLLYIMSEFMLSQAYLVLTDQKHTLKIAVECMYIDYLHHFVNISKRFSCTLTPPFNAFSFQFLLPLLLHWAWPS